MARIKEILAEMSTGDRALFEEYVSSFKEGATRAGISAIMARNNSHDLGPHMRSKI